MSVLCRAACGAIAASLWIAAVAHAQPTLRVRAETRLELTSETTIDGARLRGTLLDDLGVPLAARELIVELRAPDSGTVRRTTRTDREGRFFVDVALGEEEVARARAIFVGDDGHERLEVEREIDRRRADVRLHLVMDGPVVSLDEESHRFEARAESSAGGGALPLTLLDELGRPLGSATTAADGRAELVVPSDALGGAGAGRLVLRTDGDATRAPGRTEAPIIRQRRALLELTGPERVAAGARVSFRGRLFDANGPLPERAVGLFARDGDASAHRGSVLTRADGSFTWELEVLREDAPRLVLVARYESDEPGHAFAESAEVTTRVDVPTPTSWWSIVAIALCGLALWLARLLWRREVVVASPPRPTSTPVVLARAARGATRSSAVAGRLEDRDGQGLRGRVLARDPSREVVTETDSGGRFELALASGTYTLRFEADGHAPEQVTITLPHRGEWSAVTVRLESWRHRALSVLGRVVERVGLPGWERATIREVVAPAAPDLRALGGDVERAVYAKEPPDAESVAVLEARANDVRGAIARTDRRAR